MRRMYLKQMAEVHEEGVLSQLENERYIFISQLQQKNQEISSLKRKIEYLIERTSEFGIELVDENL